MKTNSTFATLLLISGLIFCSAINQVSAQCTENFDGVTAPALPAGWSAVTLTDCTGSNPWATSTTTPNSAPNSVFVTAPACLSDEVFVSRYYSITTATAQLTFLRKHSLEQNWDGLVLEISVDGGSFIDILAAGGSFTAGGYTTTLTSSANPISGRQAWTGSTSNSFVTTTVNLPSSLIGEVVAFRWRRGTDASGSGTGVFIDNITMTGCSTAGCGENFDGVTVPALPFGWIAATTTACANSTAWATVNTASHSAPNSAFVNSPDCISDEYLYSKMFQIISVGSQITFIRNHNLETNFDGMVLEVSIGGAPFRDIIAAGGSFLVGGYNGVISNCCGNPLAGRSAWTGNSAGWVFTVVSLPATANNKSLVLRWRRGTDNSTSGVGVYIDGLSITGSLCNPVCGTNITLTPATGSLCSNSQIVLTASVVGAVYEWYRNDVKINGVTGNTYTATVGGIYYAKSIIAGCLATSNVAVLQTIPVVPVISGTGVYCSGSSVNIDVAFTDYDQRYTWKKNGVIVYGPVTGNGGSLNFNITMSTSTAGDYVVESTKPGCTTVVSNVAAVRLPELVTGLVIEKNCPQYATIKWNHLNQEFITQNYEYQISQSATPPSSGIQYTDSIITVTVSPSTQYYFYVRYYCNGSGSVNWTSISFTTPALFTPITISPTSGSVCNNTIALTATGVSTYEWYRNNILIDGITGPSYSANSGGTYTVKSVISGCTITSNNSIISESTMVSPSLGGSGVYCTGASVDFRSTTVPTQQYSWYFINSSNGTMTLRSGPPIGGGNGGNQSLPVTMSSANEGDWVVISTKAGCGDAQSNTVHVDEAKVDWASPTLICPTQVSFEWANVAAGESYQYVVTQSSIPPANPVNPVTTSSTQATVSSLVPSTTYYFHIRAASGPDFTSFCAVWTTTSFVTPPASNTITLNPTSGSVCNNTIALTATGGSTYEWYRNNILIDFATSATYSANSGGTYTVKSVVNGCTITSNNSIISENTMTIPSLTGAGVYCTGDFVDLRSTTVSTQNYAWYLNGIAIPRQGPIGGGNGGNQSLPLTMAATDEGDWFVISTKNGCGDAQSNTVHIDQAIPDWLNTTLICPTQVSFTWQNVATGERYQYVVNQSSSATANPFNPSTTTSTQATVSSLIPSTAYYIHVRAAKSPDFTSFCSDWKTISFTTPSNSLPPATAVWIGTLNNVWTNAANWRCGLMPGSTSAVVITGDIPNYPVVTSNVTVRSLTLTYGATMQVNAGVVVTITSQ